LHASQVPRIIVDLDPPQPDAPGFSGDTSELVYFLSWAFSTRYGANHELSVAALVLRSEFKIDLVPLLTFADRQIDDPADEETLERAWQDAAPLAECCSRVSDALRSDDRRLTEIREDYPSLPDQVGELGRIAAWANERNARVRLTYTLEDET
jgi:hypothetical protein